MSRFYTIDELAENATFLMSDYQQINRMRFNKLLKDFVLPDLNITSIKDVKRQFLYRNKRLNSIEIPCDSERISSVSWVDECGRIYPLMINQALHDDIVDLGAKKDCACSCGGDLCNMIHGYESVIVTKEAKMPDGSTGSFECVNRKWYQPDGTFYEQTQEPVQEFTDGEWTDTVIQTTDRELCKLEVTETGCVRDCDENYRLVASCGCSYYGNQDCRVNIPYSDSEARIRQACEIECGCWFANPVQLNGGWNLNDAGDRIIFPPGFPFDRLLVRYYYTPTGKEARVPKIAGFAAITGVSYYDIAFNNNMIREARVRQSQYTAAQFSLLEEMNKYTLNNLYRMMSPKIYIP